MLTKEQMNNYADVLMWGLRTARKERFKKNEIVLIQFDQAAIKLAEILQGRILDSGMNPVMRFGATSVMEHNFYKKANDKQLVFKGPWEEKFFKSLNGNISIRAPELLTHLSDIDPKRIGKAVVARKPLRDLLWKREEEGLFGWTICSLETAAQAKKAGLTLRQYTNQVVRACYLDKADPVREWKSIFRNAISIKTWVNSMDVKHYHIESENMDLKIRPGERRKWLGVSGHNIPSFEIFVSPDWRGTEGVYYSDQPSFRSGNYVKGVRLTFKRGKVVAVEARKGKEFTVKQLAMDRGANRVGEFALTDKRFSKINRFMANTLYDENFGGRYGSCHLALGMSYADTYDGDASELTPEMKKKLGFNDSALHWDLVNTEKKMVTAHLKTGKRVVVYENGLFNF